VDLPARSFDLGVAPPLFVLLYYIEKMKKVAKVHLLDERSTKAF